MTTDRTLATQLIAVRVLSDLLNDAGKQIRGQLEARLLEGDRATAAVMDGDTAIPVGSVTAKKRTPGGQVTASVVDGDALVAWCQEHCPDEVQTITLVRPAFQKRLLDLVKAEGGWIDRSTGELLDVDGVEKGLTQPGGGGLMVVPNDDAADIIRAAWECGLLNLNEVLALPAAAEAST